MCSRGSPTKLSYRDPYDADQRIANERTNRRSDRRKGIDEPRRAQTDLGRVPFLASGVPDLGFDDLVLDVDAASGELDDPNGGRRRRRGGGGGHAARRIQRRQRRSAGAAPLRGGARRSGGATPLRGGARRSGGAAPSLGGGGEPGRRVLGCALAGLAEYLQVVAGFLLRPSRVRRPIPLQPAYKMRSPAEAC